MPLKHNLPGVVGVPIIYATTPPSINIEPGGLGQVWMPTLYDFTFKITD